MKATINILEKFILYLFKIRYIGLYFWSKKLDVKRRTKEIVIGDILSIFVIILTILIVFIIKIGLISNFTIKQIPNSRLVILTLIGIFSLLIGNKINKYVKKILSEENIEILCQLNNRSKKSALPFFLFVIFSPIIFIIFYALMLKIITYLFF